MNKEQIDSWKINIFESLNHIADLKTQTLSWSGNHPYLESSFAESINTLYDDFLFEDYIDYVKNEGVNKSDLHTKMVYLDNLISEYDEQEKSDLEILNDPDWVKITEAAKIIIDSWVVNS